MLRVLHGAGKDEKVPVEVQDRPIELAQERAVPVPSAEEEGHRLLKDGEAEDQATDQKDWRSKMRLLIGAFVVSGIYVRHLNHLDVSQSSTNFYRLFSLTSFHLSVTFHYLEWALLIIGSGLSTHLLHTLAKESSWARQHACICFSEQFWGGVSSLLLPRLADGLLGPWTAGTMEVKRGSFGYHWRLCLLIPSSALAG